MHFSPFFLQDMHKIMTVVPMFPLDQAAIRINLVLCGYFVIGAILEERKHPAQFGQQYVDYQRCVSMVFPFKWAGRVIFQRNRLESGI
jgi:hypothetical protein